MQTFNLATAAVSLLRKITVMPSSKRRLATGAHALFALQAINFRRSNGRLGTPKSRLVFGVRKERLLPFVAIICAGHQRHRLSAKFGDPRVD